METICQMTCRDRNRIALLSDILGAGALGIRNILALTGDHTTLGDTPQAKPVFDLDSVQLIHMARKVRHRNQFYSWIEDYGLGDVGGGYRGAGGTGQQGTGVGYMA